MSYHFDGNKLREITGPGVYIFWRGDRPIYIGATNHGLGRCCQGRHKMSRFFGDPEITLIFYPTSDGVTAFEIEERLIVEHQPEFNVSVLYYAKDLQRRLKARYRENQETTAKIKLPDKIEESELISFGFVITEPGVAKHEHWHSYRLECIKCRRWYKQLQGGKGGMLCHNCFIND